MNRRQFILIKIVIVILLAGELCAFTQPLPVDYTLTGRQRIVLVDGWKFFLDKGAKGFYSSPPGVGDWEEVTLPHTLELAPMDLSAHPDDHYQLTFHRWIGWYKREFLVDAGKGQRVYLEFEGAHQVTRCWVNGKYVGEHAIGGYTPFHFDVTGFIRPGKANEVVLSVDNRRNINIPPEGDRYDYIKWGGLYRDVYLVVTDPLHVSFPWEDKDCGVFITTPAVTEEDATLRIRTHVKNESAVDKTCRVINRVVDHRGVVVLKLESEHLIRAGSDYNFLQTGGIEEDVRLWSVDDPYLYRVNTMVMDGERPADFVENPLGIRRIEFIDGRGFVLNGRNVELIGPNRHQGMYIIGDAVPNSLHWKDAWQMKQAGFNSVRLAHYPHDNSFIEACDRLGILVYEEPPTWIGIGAEKWLDNLEEATRRMVRNHRNHPSVLFWGAAINHRGPVERLHYAAKEEDPTRPTASNGSPWTGPRNSGVCDIYSPMDYQNLPVLANEFTYLCEHGGSADASRNQFEVSKSREMANMIGVAVWTAHDYQSFKGRGDLGSRYVWTGMRMPNMPFQWYRSELRPEPMVYITNGTVSTDREIIVFSNCQKVELLHDGRRVGLAYPERSPNLLYLDHPGFRFDYEWTSGELTAIGYIDGQEMARHSRKKAGSPVRLMVDIEEDNAAFYANGSDIKMVRAYVVDREGTVVEDSEVEVVFTAEGEGRIIGTGELGANPNKAYLGVASAYLRSATKPGLIRVTAKASGLQDGSDEITTLPFTSDRVVADYQPIYDLKRERIDIASNAPVIHQGDAGSFEIGNDNRVLESEFLQFGWTAWTGEGSTASMQSSVFRDCVMELSFGEGEPRWYTQWGFVGNNPYLATDGVCSAAGGSILLTIRGLSEGEYSMKSYHNSPEDQGRDGALIQVFVSDSEGTERLVEGRLRISSGNDLFNRGPASAEYILESDGIHPLTVKFKGRGDAAEAVLNGFEISETLR